MFAGLLTLLATVLLLTGGRESMPPTPAAAGLAVQEPSPPAEAETAEPDWDALRAALISGDPGAPHPYVLAGAASVPHLEGIMMDPEAGRAQFFAANVLGDLGLEECVDPLLRGLEHEWFNVRRCAALALARTGSARARAPLEAVAAKDPYVYVDPQTKERMYLVRDDAARALAILDEMKEVFLVNADAMPPLGFELPRKKLPWPFPGGFKKQNAYNNYQQPTDGYIHAALDLLQEPGTPVKAVADGTVALIATNYPDWITHHFFIVEPEAGAGEGWCYVHVDPDSYTFRVGDRVRKGQVLGKVVKFSLGDRDGVDHLHLHYVAFEQAADGKVEMHGLYDPLMRFEWKDERAPTVHGLIFTRAGTLQPLGASAEEEGDAPLEVSGRVDVLASISDTAFNGHISAWGVPVITLEITSKKAKPWRKLVLDQRGPMSDDRQVRPLYLRYAERAPLTADLPRSPVPYMLRVTATDGDGIIEEGDRSYAWDTAERDAEGQPRFPDGEYEVIVRAWDLAGNQGEARATVTVKNAE